MLMPVTNDYAMLHYSRRKYLHHQGWVTVVIWTCQWSINFRHSYLASCSPCSDVFELEPNRSLVTTFHQTIQQRLRKLHFELRGLPIRISSLAILLLAFRVVYSEQSRCATSPTWNISREHENHLQTYERHACSLHIRTSVIHELGVVRQTQCRNHPMNGCTGILSSKLSNERLSAPPSEPHPGGPEYRCTA